MQNDNVKLKILDSRFHGNDRGEAGMTEGSGNDTPSRFNCHFGFHILILHF